MAWNELAYKDIEIRAAAPLTVAYVTSNVISPLVSTPPGDGVQVDSLNQLVLLVDLTLGSLTSAEIEVETSPDGGVTWYQTCVNETPSGTGTTAVRLQTFQISASGQHTIAIPVKAEQIRVRAKGTGTVTGSSMKITAIVGQS